MLNPKLFLLVSKSWPAVSAAYFQQENTNFRGVWLLDSTEVLWHLFTSPTMIGMNQVRRMWAMIHFVPTFCHWHSKALAWWPSYFRHTAALWWEPPVKWPEYPWQLAGRFWQQLRRRRMSQDDWHPHHISRCSRHSNSRLPTAELIETCTKDFSIDIGEASEVNLD